MKEGKPRFYTRIDDKNLKETGHRWQMCISDPAVYRRCLFRYDGWEHAIIDCGIEIFLSGKTDEYPVGFHTHHIETAQLLTERFGKDRIWVTIPDYCDDYNPGHLGDNVGRTLRNIEIYHHIKGINWIYPLQSHYKNKSSFREHCEIVAKLFDPERVAIGTVCKVPDIEFIESCAKIARTIFPDAWIHAFGPTLRSLPKIVNLIDSFDTTAYFFNPETGKRNKTRKQRAEFFKIYREKVSRIQDTRTPPLTYFDQTRDCKTDE